MQEILDLQSLAMNEVSSANSTSELKELKIKFLGSNGLISGKLREIGTYQGDKKAFGQAVNAAKSTVEQAIVERESVLMAVEQHAQFAAEKIDVTMPGRASRYGFEHILQQTTNKIKRVLGGMGFEYLEYDSVSLSPRVIFLPNCQKYGVFCRERIRSATS